LPFVHRTLDYLRQNQASIETPFGVKLNFAAAVAAGQKAAPGDAFQMPTADVQAAEPVAESSTSKLESAARDAARHPLLVIDLEDGRAWYWTRIFAVAALSGPFRAPVWLVFIGQEGERPRQVIGYISATKLVRELSESDPRLRRALYRAEAYRAALQAGLPNGQIPAHRYQYVFSQVGDAAFMRILIDQLQHPDPGILEPGQNAPETRDNWATPAEFRQKLAAWLVEDKIDLGSPPSEQASQILGAAGEIVLAHRDGTYQGIIHVGAFTRHLVRQLIANVSKADQVS
jgi:hypothetical protein